MFERRSHPLLPRWKFVLRVGRFLGASALLIAFSLALGAVGYHRLEGLVWIDSVHAAAMILTGMGPATEIKTDAGKIFDTLYALYSALVFLTSGALVLTPIAHRGLHHFHLEWDGEGGGPST
jgi:hypothetical protein